jgi:hypothetical protein
MKLSRLPFSVGLAACLLAGGGPLVALGTCLLALGPGETIAGAPPVAMTPDLAAAATPLDAPRRCDDRLRSTGGSTQDGDPATGVPCEPSAAPGPQGSAPAEGGSSSAVR